MGDCLIRILKENNEYNTTVYKASISKQSQLKPNNNYLVIKTVLKWYASVDVKAFINLKD